MKYFIITLVSLIIGLFLIHYLTTQRDARNNVSEVKYELKTDTIRDTLFLFKDKLVPIKVEKVRFDTIKQDTILPYYNNVYRDTLCQGKDTAVVLVSTSGYEHKIDSLHLELRKQEITREITRTITVEKQRSRFHISPQVGVGVGIFNKKPDIYIGVGCSYDF